MNTDQQIQERAEKHATSRNLRGSRRWQEAKEAYIKGATEERELMSNQWVSVEERLPEADLEVLCWNYDGCVVCEISDGGFRELYNWNTVDVLYWQPLPSPPIIKKG